MNFLQRELKLIKQGRELKRLREEVAALKAQTDSMRAGMRRCVTCEYRLVSKEKDDVPA